MSLGFSSGVRFSEELPRSLPELLNLYYGASPLDRIGNLADIYLTFIAYGVED